MNHYLALDRALAALKLQRPDEAERVAREGLASAPGDARLLAVLANAIASQEPDKARTREVRDHVHASVGAEPDNPWVHRMAALSMVELDDRAQAASFAARAVALDPHEPNNHGILAEQLIFVATSGRKTDQAMLDRAMEHASTTQRLAPNDAFGFLVAARVCLARNQLDWSRYYTREGLAREPDHAVGHQFLGLADEVEGKIGQASAHYVTAGRLDPTSTVPINRLRGMRKGAVSALAVFIVVRLVLGGARAAGVLSADAVLIILIASIVPIVLGFVLWPRIVARQEMVDEARVALSIDRRTRTRTRRRRGR